MRPRCCGSRSSCWKRRRTTRSSTSFSKGGMRPTSGYNSREDEAKAEIGVTSISRRAANATIVIFLATIVVVALIDLPRGALSGASSHLRADENLRQSLRAIETGLEEESRF